jgi:predicted nucleic acid-binding protein
MPITIDIILDTNILLRTPFDEKSAPTEASRAWVELVKRGFTVGTTFSNLAEFANVSTRPTTGNGLGLSPAQSQARIRSFENDLVVYSESLEIYAIWKDLIVAHNVRGTKVHDTRIVAIMLHFGIRGILTYNTSDFVRFPEIVTLHPDQVLETVSSK